MAAIGQTPTTELEAVNNMLGSIGETPLNSLTDSGLADANMARTILHKNSREVQNRGWWFNMEEEYPVSPNSDNELVLPANTLMAFPRSQGERELVLRGSKAYDKQNHTYKVDETIDFDILFFLPFEETPEAARHYIATRAARTFQAQVIGSEVLYKFTEVEETEAWMNLLQQDKDAEPHNVFRDNTYMRQMLDRGSDPSWL